MIKAGPLRNNPTLRAAVVLCAAFVVALMVAALGLPRAALAEGSLNAATVPTHIDYLPATDLVDQAGKNFSLATIKGKPVLVGFIHTSCGGVCQMMTAKMKSVAQDLKPSFASKLTLVSLTTDPHEDGPAQLASYAKAQNAQGRGWVFLTGKPADVQRVLKLYGVAADTSEDSMTHVFELRLIGPDGHELHRYTGSDIKAATIATDVKSALANK
jgi:protein SCO1/2